jgi:hypothetical protein
VQAITLAKRNRKQKLGSPAEHWQYFSHQLLLTTQTQSGLHFLEVSLGSTGQFRHEAGQTQRERGFEGEGVQAISCRAWLPALAVLGCHQLPCLVAIETTGQLHS